MEVATPYPTPFDIAELPEYPLEYPSPWFIALALITILILLWLSTILKKRYDFTHRARLQTFLASLQNQSEPSKSETALALSKVRRARQMKLLADSSSLDTLCRELEKAVYSPSTTAERRSLLAQLYVLLSKKETL